MAEQDLHHPDIDPLLEQAGGVAVAEHVRGDAVADPGLGGRGPERGRNHVGVDRPRAPAVGEQPARMPVGTPERPQRLEDRQRQRDPAIPAALAGDDAQHPVLAVDGADLEPDGFADAQAAAIHDQKAGAVCWAPYRGEQPANLVVAESLGQTLLLRQADAVFFENKGQSRPSVVV